LVPAGNWFEAGAAAAQLGCALLNLLLLRDAVTTVDASAGLHVLMVGCGVCLVLRTVVTCVLPAWVGPDPHAAKQAKAKTETVSYARRLWRRTLAGRLWHAATAVYVSEAGVANFVALPPVLLAEEVTKRRKKKRKRRHLKDGVKRHRHHHHHHHHHHGDEDEDSGEDSGEDADDGGTSTGALDAGPAVARGPPTDAAAAAKPVLARKRSGTLKITDLDALSNAASPPP
jgi:hypothetical protein